MASELEPCPFCSKTMMLRSALWPSEGDADAIIHADPTDCPMLGFSDGSADGSIIEKWNCSLSNEDDFPSDGSCVRCGSVPRNANGLCNTCLDEDAERLENTRTTPVAPVSPDTDGKCGELVTVGYMVSHEEGLGIVEEPVCYRSQAEELLAAERAEKEKLEAAWLEAEGIISDLKADKAALTARVKELEADLKTFQDGTADLVNEKIDAEFKAVDLEAKLAAAEKALEPFANAADGRKSKSVTGSVCFSQHYLLAARAVRGGKSS